MSSCHPEAGRRVAAGGFTLIEILVVITIITLLASVVLVNVIPHLTAGKQAAAAAQIKTLSTAIQLYRIQQGRYPTQAQGLAALVAKPASEPLPANYPEEGYLESRQVPQDPWGYEYIYLVPGRQGEAYEIISYGADGEPGGEGEAMDISSAK